MVVTPGTDYVTGVFLCGLAVLAGWIPGRWPRPLRGGAAVAVGALWFRIQVFAAGFPAWLATAALATPAVRRRRLLFWSCAALAFLLFVIAFYAAVDAELALPVFLEVVHDRQEPTAYSGLYLGLRDVGGGLPAIALGILLMYCASLGAFVGLYPLALWLAPRGRALRPLDAVPGLPVAADLAGV